MTSCCDNRKQLGKKTFCHYFFFFCMDLFPNSLKTLLYVLGLHWYTNWSNLSRNVGVVSGRTYVQTNHMRDRQFEKSRWKTYFLTSIFFLCTDLFSNGLKTFLYAWGFHWHPCWANLSRNVGVDIGRTDIRTDKRTDKHTAAKNANG